MSERRRLLVEGAVQGVGFRPFIYRLAAETGVSGWVSNSAQGVIIEVEAPVPLLDAFQTQIIPQKPPHSIIQRITSETVPILGETTFTIHQSSGDGSRLTIILPDLATCPDCLCEIFDPADRRYRYPFTNCTHCGPRFSIIERLPYDRPNTTMRAFTLCDACRAEYENPLNRRFHAQPNACPHCGPQLSLWDPAGNVIAARDEALLETARAIQNGEIVALKGIGGFQLLADARSPVAVRRLRERKARPEKPFAVMACDLAQVQELCEVDAVEEALLCSSEAPIVLLHKQVGSLLCDEVAPGNPNLGVMLPYTPLHHLLMADLGIPIVATSGNLSGEPICIDELQALARLGGIADFFLVHDRPIRRPVDDSVARVFAGAPVLLRRARGYAPLPIELPDEAPPTVAFGAHLKNTIAMSIGRQVFLSQHIGDLDTPEAVQALQNARQDFQDLYQQSPALIACDAHPDYQSTRLAQDLAQRSGIPIVTVQHHYAHVLACMAEHQLAAPALGVAWDGTGYGDDGTIWGGEFLAITPHSYERFAHLRPFRLPGGEQAIREPRRSALGMLYEIYGERLPGAILPGFSEAELPVFKQALARGINAPLTSSMGRFFDAVAALIGLRQRASFEGQAAMDLEFASDGANSDRCYPFSMTPVTIPQGPSGRIIDWTGIVEGILDDLAGGQAASEIAARFHQSLVEMLVEVALAAAAEYQLENVVLCGGCFQNKRLLEISIKRLEQAGLRPFWSKNIPPNDGGIALGQIAAAWRATH